MTSIYRRTALKGLTLGAGGVVLSPAIAKLKAEADGRIPAAKRFVFVVESNGVRPEQLAPSGVTRKPRPQRPSNGPDELVDIPLSKRELPFSLEPVRAYRDRMLIVQGLSGRICGGGHSTNFGALGCQPQTGGDHSKSIVGETIDGALAKQVPGIFPHLGLGISKRLENNVVYSISAAGPDQGLPIRVKPDQAYAALFGSVANGAARQEFSATNNLLDFMRDDIRRVQSRLAAPEREQLSAYLQTFESLRQRQSRLNEIEHTLRVRGPAPNDKYRSVVETDRLDAQF